ncbi:MAG: hypothetical protein ACP5FH_08755 [Terracidiphilus sp.]
MHSPTHIWTHSLGVALFCALFVAGKLMVAFSRDWAEALTRHGTASEPVSKIFLIGGKFFEVVSAIGGFVEAVAVIVLASGWMLDLLSVPGVAE